MVFGAVTRTSRTMPLRSLRFFFGKEPSRLSFLTAFGAALVTFLNGQDLRTFFGAAPTIVTVAPAGTRRADSAVNLVPRNTKEAEDPIGGKGDATPSQFSSTALPGISGAPT